MTSEAILLSSEISKPIDSNLARIAEFLGVECKFIQDDYKSGIYHLKKQIRTNDLCLITSAKTLAKIQCTYNYGDDLKYFLFKQARFIFVYGFCPGEIESSVLKYLTSGLLSSISSFDHCDYKYQLSSDLRHITKQFCGLSFGPINENIDFNFVKENNSNDLKDIISINNRPFFTTLKRNKCILFLLATNQIVDINDTIDVSFNIKKYFSQLVPPLMFLRYVFKDRCWHNKKRYASFIIDDPLLKESYGFLNYRHLLKAMDQHNFSSTIAFIPWNYNRTDRGVALLFKDRADRLSICAHGCDHTQNEFGITDSKRLNNKIRLATNRMEFHEQLTGISFDKVMVFPKGIFSRQAMKMLKCNNYLGAVNSSSIPNDANKSKVLKLSDYLDIAIMKYENFPLFLRKYPGEMIDFAFDLFLGKPLFFVEHHHYFKEGYEEIAKFIQKINSIEKDIRWRRLEEIFKNINLQKRISDENIYCKIYVNNAIIKNEYDIIQKYVIIKNETEGIPIEELSVNGKKAVYNIENNLLTLCVEIAPKSTAEIKIIYRNDYPYSIDNRELGYKVKTNARRYLSEFRDNYLSKNEVLLSLANKFMRLFS